MKRQSIAVLVTMIALAIASAASAGPLMLVDRGLPTANLNNVAGANRSNVAWVDGGFTSSTAPYIVFGDTFQNTSSQTWTIDTIRLWTVGTTTTAVLWGGIAGSTIGVVSDATYIGGATYQGSSGSSWTMHQVDFSVNITLAAGQTYSFFFDGTGGQYGIPFVHASNAALSGSPQDGSDNWMLQGTVSGGSVGNVLAWTSDSHVPGALNGGWDKPSDVNVQVFGTVPDGGTTATLLGSALIGLGLLRRKFRG
jgi:hypothetical protein